jgi:hypothetical protein
LATLALFIAAVGVIIALAAYFKNRSGCLFDDEDYLFDGEDDFDYYEDEDGEEEDEIGDEDDAEE